MDEFTSRVSQRCSSISRNLHFPRRRRVKGLTIGGKYIACLSEFLPNVYWMSPVTSSVHHSERSKIPKCGRLKTVVTCSWKLRHHQRQSTTTSVGTIQQYCWKCRSLQFTQSHVEMHIHFWSQVTVQAVGELWSKTGTEYRQELPLFLVCSPQGTYVQAPEMFGNKNNAWVQTVMYIFQTGSQQC